MMSDEHDWRFESLIYIMAQRILANKCTLPHIHMDPDVRGSGPSLDHFPLKPGPCQVLAVNWSQTSLHVPFEHHPTKRKNSLSSGPKSDVPNHQNI